MTQPGTRHLVLFWSRLKKIKLHKSTFQCLKHTTSFINNNSIPYTQTTTELFSWIMDNSNSNMQWMWFVVVSRAITKCYKIITVIANMNSNETFVAHHFLKVFRQKCWNSCQLNSPYSNVHHPRTEKGLSCRICYAKLRHRRKYVQDLFYNILH